MDEDGVRIALDYDGTYTLDRQLWDGFIFAAQESCHEVLIVTMRDEGEDVGSNASGARPPCEVIYTRRQAKLPFMERAGLHVDVWIDDNPRWLMFDGGASDQP